MEDKIKYELLGNICEFINGDRGKNYPSSKEFVDSGIPFINAGNIIDKKIDYNDMNYITKVLELQGIFVIKSKVRQQNKY